MAAGAAEHTLNTLRYSDRVKVRQPLWVSHPRRVNQLLMRCLAQELKGEGKGRDKAGQVGNLAALLINSACAPTPHGVYGDGRSGLYLYTQIRIHIAMDTVCTHLYTQRWVHSVS